MELSLGAPLVIVVSVFFLLATRVIHRAVAVLLGSVAVAAWWGPGSAFAMVVPEVLVVAAGLMVLATFVKRSGMAAWLALKAAKAGRGRPARILVLTGILTFVSGALLGPAAAVVLVVPVALLLATELDVPPLPFVVVLNWAALLGGASTATAFPGHLWLSTALDISGLTWLTSILPITAAALATTLVAGVVGFRKQLRVTNERRARVLEFDESQSLSDRPTLIRTMVAVFLVVLGLIAAPWFQLAPSLVIASGAILLLLWDGPRNFERTLADLDGGTLLFYGGLFVVVGVGSELTALVVSLPPPEGVGLLWGAALLATVLDHGAVSSALIPFLKTWTTAGGAPLWPFVVLGTTLGAGASVWGSISTAMALGLAGQGSRRTTWRDFSRYGLVFAALNLGVVSVAGWLLIR